MLDRLAGTYYKHNPDPIQIRIRSIPDRIRNTAFEVFVKFDASLKEKLKLVKLLCS